MTHNVILAVHFWGLFMGGAAGIGMLILGAKLAAAPVEHRASMGTVAGPLKTAGKIGMGLLILTGVLLATIGDVWSAGPALFWIKLVFVVLLLAGIIAADKAGAKAMAGDVEAAAKARMFGLINLVSAALVLLTASFAFQ